MTGRDGIFAGEDPFQLAQSWLDEAAKTEVNDANAIALATVDADGLPDVRTVLLKAIEADAFVFYTNYESAKGRQLTAHPQAAFVMHWKSLRRQIRVRGHVAPESAAASDAYFATRALQSRIGAWASQQSRPLESREVLMERVATFGAEFGENPPRPEYWGGFRITPLQIEFWADGAFRLHDRFQWARESLGAPWNVKRLYP
ncbi:pyridoxamine 5'-phosphate oxidase [Ketogulonicigenium robustum]|uniref:Pyridoxine/pyridoxamine 5'-phosphate oxidase n=1 Tax=Ketogulonicigenium robustum TaxID=92947 RepID=A0A1W6NYA4_9RHOB|nr:pyridoxamine 5'-phosphate oxidase [Ketogulonicigenium robustum]ARO14225.1 pyridoxamine 5'-phosphate oxidase [Ketogulonicigenium robustum]